MAKSPCGGADAFSMFFGRFRSQSQPQPEESLLLDPQTRSRVEQLVPLFAPYCGGVSNQNTLVDSIVVLLHGSWTGERPLEGGRSHSFELRWSGEPAPLETLHCEIGFPAMPSVTYQFDLPAHQLVQCLMLRWQRTLPDAFWRWLLMGIPLSSAENPFK